MRIYQTFIIIYKEDSTPHNSIQVPISQDLDMPGLFQVGVAFLLEESDKILIGKRHSSKDFAAGIWELPSGRLEEGETIEEAIRREGREELGVLLTPTTLLDAYTFKRGNRDLLLLTYSCTFEGSIAKSYEHSELKWVDPKEAIELFSFDLQKRLARNFI